MLQVNRGEIYYADLNPVVGSEQGGARPVLVVQNDVGNHFSPTVIVAAITSRLHKARLPTHVEISSVDVALSVDSVVLLEQIRTIDKSRLREKVSRLPEGMMDRIDQALKVSLGIPAELGEEGEEAADQLSMQTGNTARPRAAAADLL